MSDLIREAPLGQLIRYLTKNRMFKYPEELPDYELPPEYTAAMTGADTTGEKRKSSSESPSPSPTPQTDLEKQEPRQTVPGSNPALESRDTEPIKTQTANDPNSPTQLGLKKTKSRADTIPFSEERFTVEAEEAVERTQSVAIVPTKTSDGVILVDWYTTVDPANPQNWSPNKKLFVAIVLCAYTFVVYTGSAIYTSSELGVIDRFGVTPLDASLPLALYVLAYGMGPMIWSPLSEIPVIGRSPVYATTMCIFVLLSIGPPLVENFAGLLVLRFLQGFFGSPCLATGGATMQDMYSLLYLPYALSAWVSAAYCGPALGPLLSGYAVMFKGWRWSLWEILWAAAPIFLVMFALLPETSTPNILLRRARRLRKLTGDNRLMAQSEITQKNMKPSGILVDAIIKPMEITIKDPAIAFVNTYAAIIYGIYYSFFEVFPLVYPVYYGFNLGEIGVVFLCVLISCGAGVAVYCLYMHYYLIPDIKANGLRAQESRLVPALYNVFGAPIGLFLFAWTARASIHWIAPTIGIVIYGGTVFVVFQCMFVYVPLSYPQYAASLFAANDFFRSSFACGSILFARPLFINLGVHKGVTVLAGLSFIGVIGMFVLYYYGAYLRARSRFAVT